MTFAPWLPWTVLGIGALFFTCVAVQVWHDNRRHSASVVTVDSLVRRAAADKHVRDLPRVLPPPTTVGPLTSTTMRLMLAAFDRDMSRLIDHYKNGM